MKHTHPFFVFSAALCLLAEHSLQAADASWPEVTQDAKPWTRWWWMGSDVDSANLTRNLEAMSRAGIGGVEVTPIYGVKGREANAISYLSPRWMGMLSFTQSEAKRLGMGVDMSNGTGWPFGGPEVTLDDAATKAIFQTYALKGGQALQEAITVGDEKQRAMARLGKLMAFAESSGERWDITDKVAPDGKLDWTAPPEKDCKLIALFVGKTLQQVKRAAPGGQGYVLDHLNKEAVQRYFGKFDKAFAAAKVPYPHGFFNDSYEVYGADWTPSLLYEFEQRRGYRLQDYFPELLAGGATEASARVMADYRETVGDLLRENFTQVWTDWAHAHGSTTRNQAHGSPANLLDLYAMVDVPECESFGVTDFDIPGLRKDSIRKPNDGSPVILKYASSAAHVTGKKYTSSETFTWLTEHFRTSLSQCKPEIDAMFTSGVNRVFFHGATYSPSEAAWPGWKFYASIDMSPTNSIWRDAPAFFEYIARAQSFLQSGQPDNDFLLYLPIRDILHEMRGKYYLAFSIHNVLHRLDGFNQTAEEIMRSGFDADYISDRLILTTTVENGLLKTEGGARYKALILPSVKRIAAATMAHIRELERQGAAVHFAGRYPDSLAGLPDAPPPTTAQILSKYEKGSEAFVRHNGGNLIRRRHNEGYIYFFAMLKNNPTDGWVALGTPAESAVLFDPMTGRKGKARLRSANGATEAYLQLRPGESIILKTFTAKNVQADDWVYYQPSGREIALKGSWSLQFVESEPPVQTVFRLPAPASWTELGNDTLTRNMGTALYKTQLSIGKKEKGKEYRLCLGDVRESAVVRVNGKKAGTLFAVPFEVNIGDLLQPGSNTLEVEVTNLPANRIADYDRRGVEWRIFREINFVNIAYSNTRFDTW
ncbi:MAG: glycosyl hydrolase family 2, partial [Prevotellaceae bacterium]|nr:glycosyl hydrolase family 2 [Prevotellaceae bacterium]